MPSGKKKRFPILDYRDVACKHAFITTEAGAVPFGIIKMTDLTKVVRSVRNDPRPIHP